MAATSSYGSSEPFERDDIELVKMFLSGFKDGNSYALAARPEVTERNQQAVEAIAVAPNGSSLAIEHTSVQPFERQKADDVPFTTVFEQLRTDSTLKMPNRFVDVLVPAFAVPKGVDWKVAAAKVREWYLSVRESIPVEGEHQYSIPGLGFELTVTVQTFELPGAGVLVTGRILPAGEPFAEVLQKSLRNKVPKLAATSADKRILLIQDEGVSIGFARITTGIDAELKALPELKKIDEVWVAKTMGWKSDGDVLFIRVWPGGAGPRFWLKDTRFAKQPPVPK